MSDKNDEPIKVMFICHGNICRSPMAEFVMKHLISQKGLSHKIKAYSSAVSREEIGNDIHYGTRDVLKKHKIPFQPRSAVQLKRSDKDKYDYLVVMDKSNISWIKDIIGSDLSKVHLLLEFAGEKRDIADPWYSGDFDTTYRDVVKGCTALLDTICTKMDE